MASNHLHSGSGYTCPLCSQPVSKKMYSEITGIWEAQQKAQEKYLSKLKELKQKKAEIQKQYSEKLQQMQTKNKARLEKALAQKTSFLNNQISQLRKASLEQKRKAGEQVQKAVQTAQRREQVLYKKREAQITRTLQANQRKEVAEMRKKAREMAQARFKLLEHATKEKVEKKVVKLEQSKQAALKTMEIFRKQNVEQTTQIIELKKQLARETTPQIEGLLYEDTLLAALRKEFPEDEFRHTGKGGDIIQLIRHKAKTIGGIVYECKRVRHFQTAHITQAAEAKLKRKTDYAILVTNATSKGYKGFSMEKGVLIVHPAGVISLVHLLRGQLVSIDDMKLSGAQRSEAIQKTIQFIEGPEFKNSMDAVIQETQELYDSLCKEVLDHKKAWKRRYVGYVKIRQETLAVKIKTNNALTGKKQEQLDSGSELPALPGIEE